MTQYCLHCPLYRQPSFPVECVLQLHGLFSKSFENMSAFSFLLKSPCSNSCRLVNQWYNILTCSHQRLNASWRFFMILWIFAPQNLEILMQKKVFHPNFFFFLLCVSSCWFWSLAHNSSNVGNSSLTKPTFLSAWAWLG